MNAAAQEQLGENQSRLDGLAESDIIGNQQADARHTQRLQKRHKLVVLDSHAAVERTGDGFASERPFAVRVEVGR